MEERENKPIQVWTGRHVDVELIFENGDVDRLELDVVADNEADFENGFLGESTPLAKAIMGKMAGSMVPYRAGDIIQVRILSVAAELSSKPVDLSERREETTRKAAQDSDKISTVIYASSMNNKWGDMDPKLLEDDGEEDSPELK